MQQARWAARNGDWRTGLADAAAHVLASVISVQPNPDGSWRALLDSGSKTLTSDTATGHRGHGTLVDHNLTIARLSEEHAVVEGPADRAPLVGEQGAGADEPRLPGGEPLPGAGARGGWVFVLDAGGALSSGLVPDIALLIRALPINTLIASDVPIGLPEQGAREADRLARARSRCTPNAPSPACTGRRC